MKLLRALLGSGVECRAVARGQKAGGWPLCPGMASYVGMVGERLESASLAMLETLTAGAVPAARSGIGYVRAAMMIGQGGDHRKPLSSSLRDGDGRNHCEIGGK